MYHCFKSPKVKADKYLEFEALLSHWEELYNLIITQKDTLSSPTLSKSGSQEQLDKLQQTATEAEQFRSMIMWRSCTLWPSGVRALSEVFPLVVRKVMSAMTGMIIPVPFVPRSKQLEQDEEGYKKDEQRHADKEKSRIWKLEESYLMGLRSTAARKGPQWVRAENPLALAIKTGAPIPNQPKRGDQGKKELAKPHPLPFEIGTNHIIKRL